MADKDRDNKEDREDREERRGDRRENMWRRIERLVERKLDEAFEDIGIDTSSTDKRFSYREDFVFLRKMRSNKQDIGHSLKRVITEKIVQALFTLLACGVSAAISFFLSSGFHK